MTTGLTINGDNAPQSIDIRFDSRGDRLIGLGVVNAILRVLSLGLYSFWAKTEVRRRLWSFTKLNGEPLQYTGTGKELFLGFLIVFGAVFLPMILIGVAIAMMSSNAKDAIAIYQLCLYIVIFLLVGNAVYRAQRYRMSRTLWRGIRGGLVGSPGSYGWMYFWTLALPVVIVAGLALLTAVLIGPDVGGGIILIGLALGLWILPWRSNRLQRAMTNDMRFGDRPFSYTGTAGPLYKRYLYAWFASAIIYIAAIGATAVYVLRTGIFERWQTVRIPPTLIEAVTLAAIWILALFLTAVLTAWYRANQYKHFAEHTHFEGASFAFNGTGRSLMWLVISNWLLQTLALVLGLILGTTLMIVLGAVPDPAPAGAAATREPNFLATVLVILPIVLLTTVASTFAQFRWVRYFVSRLKLNGPVDLGAVLQGQDQGIKRGEGLAQMFDIDAF